MTTVVSAKPAMAQCHHNTNMCPACGSSATAAQHAWKFVNSRGETEWLQCSQCRSYFMNRQYSVDSETAHTQQMTWGDTAKGELLNKFKSRMYNSILTQIDKHLIASNCSLLDIGCSYGGFMEAAREKGIEVCGFDIVPQAVDRVRKAGMTAQCCGQVRDFTARSGLFDVITVLDANIYWPDQPRELNGIYRRLKPGGLLVMRVVNKSMMAGIGAALQRVSAEQGQKILRRSVNDHRFSMPIGSFLGVLKNSGFRVVSVSATGAIHSDRTSLPVKLLFQMGGALWKMFGIFLAPGAVVIAERPK